MLQIGAIIARSIPNLVSKVLSSQKNLSSMIVRKPADTALFNLAARNSLSDPNTVAKYSAIDTKKAVAALSVISGVSAASLINLFNGDASEWSSLSPAQKGEIVNAIYVASQSEASRTMRTEVTSMLREQLNMDVSGIAKSVSNMVTELVSSDSLLKAVRDETMHLTPFEFLFGMSIAMPEVVVPLLGKFLGSADASALVASSIITLLESLGVDSDSSDLKTLLLEQNSDIVPNDGCTLENLNFKFSDVRALEKLLGVRGYLSNGDPALATLLDLLSKVSSADVRKFYEVREYVR